MKPHQNKSLYCQIIPHKIKVSQEVKATEIEKKKNKRVVLKIWMKGNCAMVRNDDK